MQPSTPPTDRGGRRVWTIQADRTGSAQWTAPFSPTPSALGRAPRGRSLSRTNRRGSSGGSAGLPRMVLPFTT